MRKVVSLIIILIAILSLTACTANQRAKDFGGTMKIDLPAGEKLINATWKETNLWYLTRKRAESEKPETLTFSEDSTFGVMKGTVIFIEH